MIKLPLKRYPRRTVRVDVSHLRRKASAITERARRDLIIIIRVGKPEVVIMHWERYSMLKRATDARAIGANLGTMTVARRFNLPKGTGAGRIGRYARQSRGVVVATCNHDRL